LTDEINEKETKAKRPYRRHYSRKPYVKKTEDTKVENVNDEIVTEVKEENIEKKAITRRPRRRVSDSANLTEKPLSEKNKKIAKPIVEKRLISPATSGLKRERLKIIPLGGLEEIGKNMTVFEYGNEMFLLDCGVAFPEDDLLGVDLVIPDITYLEKNKSKLKGMVITHGHEDHIGAIPYVLKQINTPIYATRLTLGLIKTKLEEHKLVRGTALKCVKAGDIIELGKNFKIEFIQSTHSIADSVMVAIHTPVGVIVHTGDFKVDFTPIDGRVMDFARLAELGKQGVLALMSDSTNSEREGFTMSESTVGKVFDNIFADCKKRIIVATFASNVHRVQQIVYSAMKNNRKLAICGRSMLNVMTVAKDLGYLNIPEGMLIDIDEIDNYTPDKLVIITTGSQGETMAGLSRMAAGSHRQVTLNSEDLVILSASPIPGNEKLVSNVIDDLYKLGVDVVYSALADIHVSGHACKEEQKLILSLVKPKYFIPVHGEYRHIRTHAETAMKVGIPEENIVLLVNGKVLELDRDFCKITGSVPAGRVFIDGLGVGDVGNIVLRDRQHLSQDGLIIVVIAMEKKTGKILAGPDLISRGFVYVRESEDLMVEMRNELCKDLAKFEANGTKDWSTIKNTLKDTLHDFVYVRTKRNPMIIPIISEI
jgi:ribonuclease J